MKKVIITGATGFIGGALTKNLLSEGITVYGIDMNKQKLDEMKQYGDFIPVVADFSKYDKLHEMIVDKDIDVFFHFAWAGVFGNSFKDYALQLNNAKFACDALIQAVEIGCKKFVFAGTDNEYEIMNLLKGNVLEPRYTCIYSGAKTISEVVCKTLAYNNRIEYSAGLVAMAYGENNKSMMLPNVVLGQLLRNESPKLIEGDNLYDMIYIDDIVSAFALIGEKGHNMKSYYVGHRKLRTFKEILTDIGETINPNVEMKFGEYKDTDNKDYSLVDLDALYEDTGFECKCNFTDSIIKTANWLKEQKM